ncbi:MAG: hypothetical protein WHT46_01975, partial [Candidatus Geothermincolales bacterium]
MMRDLLANLDGGLGRKVAEALNDDPSFVVELMANLNAESGKAMAEGSNLNTSGFMEQLLANLSTDLARAAAQALDANPDLIKEVLANLSAETGTRMGQASNANPDLMRVIMENLSPATATALAQGLNAANSAFITNLVRNLNADTGAAVGRGINAMAAGGTSSALFAALVATEQPTVEAIARSLNANPSFLDAVIDNLDVSALATAVNAGLDAPPMYFLRNNLYASDAAMMARVSASDEFKNLLNMLLGNPDPSKRLDPAKVAQALNQGAQPFLYALLGGLDGKGLASLMNQYGDQMTMDIVNTPGLAGKVVDAINATAGNSASFVYNFGLGNRFKLRDPILGLIGEVLGWAVFTQAGLGDIPP